MKKVKEIWVWIDGKTGVFLEFLVDVLIRICERRRTRDGFIVTDSDRAIVNELRMPNGGRVSTERSLVDGRWVVTAWRAE